MMKRFNLKIIRLVCLAVMGIFILPVEARVVRGDNSGLCLGNGKIIFTKSTITKLKKMIKLSEELNGYEIGGIGEKSRDNLVDQFFVHEREEIALIKVFPEYWGIFDDNPIMMISIILKQLIVDVNSGIERNKLVKRLNAFVGMLKDIERDFGKKVFVQIKDLVISPETLISDSEVNSFIVVSRGVKAIASEGSIMYINGGEYFHGLVEIHYHPGELASPSIGDLIDWFAVRDKGLPLLGKLMYRGIIVDTFEGKKLLLFEISHENMDLYHRLLHITISYIIEKAIKEGNKEEEERWRKQLKSIGEEEPLKNWYKELEKLALKDGNGKVPILVSSD